MLEITIFKDAEGWFTAMLLEDYRNGFSEDDANYGVGTTEIEAVRNLFRYLGILDYNYN